MTESWFESSDVVSMFPTLVWKTRLRANVHRSLNETLTDELAEMRKLSPELERGQSWQSGHELHLIEESQDLLACVHRAAEAVLEDPALQQWLSENLDAAIAKCWNGDAEGRLKPLMEELSQAGPAGLSYAQIRLALMRRS